MRQHLTKLSQLLRAAVQPRRLLSQDAQAARPIVSAERKMGAWQVHAYGDALQFSDRVKVPVIADANDVLVRVTASSLNAIDVEMASKQQTMRSTVHFEPIK